MDSWLPECHTAEVWTVTLIFAEVVGLAECMLVCESPFLSSQWLNSTGWLKMFKCVWKHLMWDISFQPYLLSHNFSPTFSVWFKFYEPSDKSKNCIFHIIEINITINIDESATPGFTQKTKAFPSLMGRWKEKPHEKYFFLSSVHSGWAGLLQADSRLTFG